MTGLGFVHDRVAFNGGAMDRSELRRSDRDHASGGCIKHLECHFGSFVLIVSNLRDCEAPNKARSLDHAVQNY